MKCNPPWQNVVWFGFHLLNPGSTNTQSKEPENVELFLKITSLVAELKKD